MGRTYHVRSTDLEDVAIARPQRCLAANHVGAIAQHQDTYERVTIDVPPDDRLVVFPWTASNALVISIETLLLGQCIQLLLGLFL